MKKILFVSVLAAASVLSFSCNKENAEGGAENETAYFAPQSVISASSKAATKTVLSGTAIHWAQGDAISLFGASGKAYTYTLASGEGSTEASFAIDETPAEEMAAYALYPVSASDLNDGTVSVTVDADQTYAPDGFSAGYPMAAKTVDGTNYLFDNLATVLSLPLKGDATVKSITIEAKGETEYIAGAATVNFDGETPVLSGGDSKTVTLTCTEPVKLDDETETFFNFILIPGEYPSGLKITVVDTQTEAGRTVVKEVGAVTLKPGTIKKFGMALGVPHGWNLTGSFTDNWVSYIPLEELRSGMFYAENIVVPEDGAAHKFKVRYAGDEWYGGSINLNNASILTTDGSDIEIQPGTYNIFFDQNTKGLYVMDEGQTPFGVVGANNNWGNEGGGSDARMVLENGYLVAYDLSMTDGGFKIRLMNDTSWKDVFNFGASTSMSGAVFDAPIEVRDNTGAQSGNPNSDILISAGIYDVWFDIENMKVWVITDDRTPDEL